LEALQDGIGVAHGVFSEWGLKRCVLAVAQTEVGPG
jgi:hypothetical protein